MLRLAVRPCRGGIGFDLRRYAASATIAVGRDGREHALLADCVASLRVDVEEGSLLSGPVMPRYRLRGVSGLSPQLRSLRRFLQLCRSGHLPGPAGTPADGRIAQALIVHDARAAGASLRELAGLLYGTERARDWPGEGDSIKSGVRRLVALSERLAADPWSVLT